MDLYFGRTSGNSSRAVFALLEARAAFTPHVLDTTRGEHKEPAYLAINPMGKIPSLVDGELRLWESNAIGWYAAEKNPGSGLLPATPEGRARVQRWLFFQAAHVSPACLPIFRTHNERVRAFWKLTGDPQAAEAGRKELQRYLPVLEDALSHGEYLDGAFSLADVAYVPHFTLIQEGGFDFAPYPRVQAWLTRLQQRPAWRRTFELVFGS